MIRKIEKVDILLLIISTILTLVLALGIIRWIQPSLLGIADDLVLVQSSKEVPPFYENVFRKDDLISNEFILSDPLVKGRAIPLFPNMGSVGPNDILGFRNTGVPNSADIIVIGDSQTYGNNALIWDNWPHILQVLLPTGNKVYSMATGGWGAVQYFYAFAKSLALMPRVVVIAFYSGNDSLETFSMAYGSDIWSEFAIDKSLSKDDIPQSNFPPSAKDQFPVTFADGTMTIFTPQVRHISNMDHPAVDAGYKIMGEIAMMIAEKAMEKNIKIVFTIIPTKELVFHKKIQREKINLPESYYELISDEQKRINNLSNILLNIKNAVYVDVVENMQDAALDHVMLYPADINGHPLKPGYAVIARTIEPAIKSGLNAINDGLARLYISSDDLWLIVMIKNGEFQIVDEIKEGINHKEFQNLPQVYSYQLENLVYHGHVVIESADELE